ncbi:hypothetical protein MMC13_002848 [Lambiella insularis]|nr:hypothetical protein [Lambiella insularis]
MNTILFLLATSLATIAAQSTGDTYPDDGAAPPNMPVAAVATLSTIAMAPTSTAPAFSSCVIPIFVAQVPMTQSVPVGTGMALVTSTTKVSNGIAPTGFINGTAATVSPTIAPFKGNADRVGARWVLAGLGMIAAVLL